MTEKLSATALTKLQRMDKVQSLHLGVGLTSMPKSTSVSRPFQAGRLAMAPALYEPGRQIVAMEGLQNGIEP